MQAEKVTRSVGSTWCMWVPSNKRGIHRKSPRTSPPRCSSSRYPRKSSLTIMSSFSEVSPDCNLAICFYIRYAILLCAVSHHARLIISELTNLTSKGNHEDNYEAKKHAKLRKRKEETSITFFIAKQPLKAIAVGLYIIKGLVHEVFFLYHSKCFRKTMDR